MACDVQVSYELVQARCSEEMLVLTLKKRQRVREKCAFLWFCVSCLYASSFSVLVHLGDRKQS